MYNFKDKIEDYTEREFIELLGEFTNPTGDNAQLKGEVARIAFVQRFRMNSKQNLSPENHHVLVK